MSKGHSYREMYYSTLYIWREDHCADALNVKFVVSPRITHLYPKYKVMAETGMMEIFRNLIAVRIPVYSPYIEVCMDTSRPDRTHS